jgi:L-lactate utilization protein LutB
MTKTGIQEAGLESCIYCGACFRYCILGVYSELDGMELKSLVSGVTRIARTGYRSGKDDRIKELLERCTLQGYCDKVCPSMVKPLLRNEIAKKRIEEGK